MRKAILVAFTLLCTPVCAPAQTFSPADLARRTIERRAVEAAIWGMPAVSMAGVRKSLAGIGADYNQVVYFSKPLEARHEFLTANNQTPYVMSVLDLHAGRSFSMSRLPATRSHCSAAPSTVGRCRSSMSGRAARTRARAANTSSFRPALYGSPPGGLHRHSIADVLRARGPAADHHRTRHACRRRGLQPDAKGLPACRASNPQTKYVDAYPQPWKTLPVYDLTYFRDLAAVVADEPAQEKDAVMLGHLGEHRHRERQAVQSDRRAGRAFERAVQDAYATMQDYFTTPGKALVPHWPDRQWMASHHTQTQDFTFVVDGKLLVDERAGGFAFGRPGCRRSSAQPAPIRRRYATCGQAPVGQHLSASGACRHASARFLVGHRLQHEDQVDDPQPAKSRRPLLLRQVDAANERGRQRRPLLRTDRASGKEANWLPTGEDFFLIFRLYGPGKPIFDKTWKMNDIEQVNEEVGIENRIHPPPDRRNTCRNERRSGAAGRRRRARHRRQFHPRRIRLVLRRPRQRWRFWEVLPIAASRRRRQPNRHSPEPRHALFLRRVRSRCRSGDDHAAGRRASVSCR